MGVMFTMTVDVMVITIMRMTDVSTYVSGKTRKTLLGNLYFFECVHIVRTGVEEVFVRKGRVGGG